MPYACFSQTSDQCFHVPDYDQSIGLPIPYDTKVFRKSNGACGGSELGFCIDSKHEPKVA
jgi:hypothetical protein